MGGPGQDEVTGHSPARPALRAACPPDSLPPEPSCGDCSRVSTLGVRRQGWLPSSPSLEPGVQRTGVVSPS